MTITLKYLKNFEPQNTEVGGKYLLLCSKDTVLKRGEKVGIETGTAIYGGGIRIDPLISTYVKHNFDISKTVFLSNKDGMTKVIIPGWSITNEDVIVKEGTPICAMRGLNDNIVMQQVNEDLYSKYRE